MISRRSQLIGVIIPQTGSSHRLMFDNPFYGEFLSAVEYVVREGISPTTFRYGAVPRLLQYCPNAKLGRGNYRGTYPSEFLDELKKTGIPVVLVDAYIQDHYFHTVSINDRHGGYLATKYLIDKGHREIAFVSEKLRDKGVHHQRFLGYSDALEEAGIPLRKEFLYEGDVAYHGGFAVAQEMVKRGKRETAAFAVADIMALGLVNGLRAQCLSVPEDISVIGFDNVPLSTMSLPEITTVNQDIWEKGSQAARIVIEAVEGGAKRDVILPLHIVERDSVKDINLD